MSRAHLRRLIFAGCRELGLGDDERRALQHLTVGKDSLADMSTPEMSKVVGALKSRGFEPKSGQGGKHGRRKPAPRADLRLIHVLWSKLGQAGRLDRPDRAGLNAFIRSRFGAAWGAVPADIDMLRDHGQIEAVIRALKSWCEREGINVRRPESSAE
ncbi:MAG: regulatory protein GemA [Rhodobacter sp.]|nr:regulatory protein GemA [Rhodobacter sp.]